MQTHGVGIHEFSPQVSDNTNEILITMQRHAESETRSAVPDYLGYIRFKKALGSLEFANFGASLDPQCLELGYTTKSEEDHLTSGRGKGLKIAALVLCRNDYHLRICSNNSYWNFGFRGKHRQLYCQLSSAGSNKIRHLKTTYETCREAGNARKLAANIWEDVSVFVGNSPSERRVTIEEFRDWMKVTFDLNCPSAIVHTLCGDLILDKAYAGHLYVKGIRVPLMGFETQRFHFGYNLTGSLYSNRDRQRGTDQEKVAEMVASIWESAIRQRQEEILPQYVSLLRYQPLSADVIFADKMVTEGTAKEIWATLAAEAKEMGTFYYTEGYEGWVGPLQSQVEGTMANHPKELADHSK